MFIANAVECIEDVRMDVTDELAFKKGEVYPVTINCHGYITATDETGEEHGLGHIRDKKDDFVYEYFTWKGKM